MDWTYDPETKSYHHSSVTVDEIKKAHENEQRVLASENARRNSLTIKRLKCKRDRLRCVSCEGMAAVKNMLEIQRINAEIKYLIELGVNTGIPDKKVHSGPYTENDLLDIIYTSDGDSKPHPRVFKQKLNAFLISHENSQKGSIIKTAQGFYINKRRNLFPFFKKEKTGKPKKERPSLARRITDPY
jgi:hypothetical protein